jgi:hypothetical protein
MDRESAIIEGGKGGRSNPGELWRRQLGVVGRDEPAVFDGRRLALQMR